MMLDTEEKAKIDTIASQVERIHTALVGLNGGGLIKQVEKIECTVGDHDRAIAGMTGVRGFMRDGLRIFLMVAALLVSLWAAGAFSK